MRGPRPHAEELPARLGRVVATANDGVPLGVRGVDAPGGPAVEFRPPALVRAVVLAAEVPVHEVELAVESLPVLVLVVRQPQRRLECRAEGRRDAEAIARPAATILRHDDDRPVRRAGAVQCCGVRPLQHGHRLDVVDVDVRGPVPDIVPAQRRRRVGRRRAVAGVRGRRIVDRDSVDHEQRLVLSQDRAPAARDDPRRAEGVARVRDLKAGHVALERRHNVRAGHLPQPVSGDGLRRVRERRLLTLDAERCRHNFLQLDCLRAHGDVDDRRDPEDHAPVADAREGQAVAPGRNVQRVAAARVRHHADGCTHDRDAHSGQRISRAGVLHLAGHVCAFLCGRCSRDNGEQSEQHEPAPKDGPNPTTIVCHTNPPDLGSLRAPLSPRPCRRHLAPRHGTTPQRPT